MESRQDVKIPGLRASQDSESLFRTLFIVLCVVLLAVMVLASQSMGITWDERMQGHYGKLLLRYFLTGGANHDFMHMTQDMHYYGGFFDILSGAAYGLLSGHPREFIFSGLQATLMNQSVQDIWGSGYYETRHVLNALFGLLAMIFTGLTARMLRSWRAALIALVFIALSPRFFAHSMNNPKDLPFATCYILSLYFMLKFIRELPHPGWKTLLFLALAMAATINVRIGGLLVVIYFAFFALMFWFYDNLRGKPTMTPLAYLGIVGLVCAAGYFGGLLFWPYGQLDPLRNPFIALRAMSRFIGAESKLLFEGRLYLASALPWYYIPKWILISSPLYFATGLVFFLLLIPAVLRATDRRLLFMIFFVVLFPVGYVVYRGSVLYDAWRHFLFIYPPLVVLAALGWDHVLDLMPQKGFRILAATILGLHCLQPLGWMIRNHPNETVYFNSTVGGLKGAFSNYQMDYWGNCFREGAEWLREYHKKTKPGRPIIIATNAYFMSAYPYLKGEFGTLLIPFDPLPPETKKKLKYDYFFVLPRGLRKSDLLDPHGWPPPGTLYEVKADGVTLCAVVDAREMNRLTKLYLSENKANPPASTGG